ncbi:MAG: crossover junction endodeoxyribonuclease RuvC [Acidobacteriota bacterium]|nr:crossover junction endodeoxyribonuclease RuvC [Acidobacteriota bacterium]
MRIFGIDPGSERTGYGCIDSDGSRCQLVARGVISLPSSLRFPDKLVRVFDELVAQLARHRPACVAVEGVFYARNARSALILGQVRGVVLLAAGKAALPVSEYAATAVKSAVVGYGRADKRQVQHMVSLLLGLDELPSPHDVSDALAIAICHAHTGALESTRDLASSGAELRSWRRYRTSGDQ